MPRTVTLVLATLFLVSSASLFHRHAILQDMLSTAAYMPADHVEFSARSGRPAAQAGGSVTPRPRDACAEALDLPQVGVA